MSFSKRNKPTFRQLYKESQARTRKSKLVKPFYDLQEAMEQKDKQLEEAPETAVNDADIQKLRLLIKEQQKLTAVFRGGFRNLLLAHAGGAVVTINTLPNVVTNKPLFRLAVNALDHFAWGLLLLLAAAIIVFLNDWLGNSQSILKALGIQGKLLEFDTTTITTSAAGVCGLISLYLFASAILSTANGLSGML